MPRPLIVANESFENQLSGIGTEGSEGLIVIENHVHHNETAGIGLRGKQTHALISGNRLTENRLVALGMPDGATALIHNNQMIREQGQPPLVAIRGGAKVLMAGNQLRGGGVATIMIEGEGSIFNSEFTGKGTAIWALPASRIDVVGNHFQGYQKTVPAKKENIRILQDNTEE